MPTTAPKGPPVSRHHTHKPATPAAAAAIHKRLNTAPKSARFQGNIGPTAAKIASGKVTGTKVALK